MIAFGALFSNVKVIRHDNNGAVSQVVGVPISYGPKEKIFVKDDIIQDFKTKYWDPSIELALD